MFGSMPWCSLADAKELLVMAEGDCCRFAEGKLSPCLCGHQCFSVVAHQDSPKASPRAFLK